MAQNNPVPHVSPEEVAAHQAMWVNFTHFVKWGTVGAVASLILLAMITL